MAWTAERVVKLTELWRAGLSASQIAAHFGDISRNAVIGKVHRMGLAGSSRPYRKAGTPQYFRKRKAQPLPKPPPDEPEPLNLTLVQLTEHTCKWPVNTGGPYLFCGHASEPDSSYCEHHTHRSLNKASGGKKPFTQYAAWLSKQIITAGA